jgi:hypothetical protein
MSTADREHHHPHGASFGHIVLGLVAGALALIAAYLWLTDGAAPVAISITSTSPAPSSVPVAAAPLDRPAATSVASPPPHAQIQAVAPTPTPIAAETVQDAPPQNGALDPQVAADAAAVGMTARVRPAEPAPPGQ